MKTLAALTALFALSAPAVAETVSITAQSGLNCRASASKDSDFQGLFETGANVEVRGRHGNWLLVKCPNGDNGFIYNGYTRASGLEDNPGGAYETAKADDGVPQDTQAHTGGGSCTGPQRRVSKFTEYYAPVLQSFSKRPCHNMEGTCFYKKGGTTMLYNYGIGHQVASRASCKLGYGSTPKTCLNPCDSVAADSRYHRRGERLFIANLKGKICQGKPHSGYVTVVDVGSAIKGEDRFDFYWGPCYNYDISAATCKDRGEHGRAGTFPSILTGSSYCKVGRAVAQQQTRQQQAQRDYSDNPGAQYEAEVTQ